MRTVVMLLVGGSRRVCGSQTLGGSTVRPSIYSSIPLTKSSAVLALYATSQKICNMINVIVLIRKHQCVILLFKSSLQENNCSFHESSEFHYYKMHGVSPLQSFLSWTVV